MGGNVKIGSSTSIKDVTLVMYKNPAITANNYNSTIIFTTMASLEGGGNYSYSEIMSGWEISGHIGVNFISGSAYNDCEILFNQVMITDYNTTHTFMDLNSSSGNANGSMFCRFIGCSGHAVTVYNAVKCPIFNILEIRNCTFAEKLYCNKLGLIIDSSFYTSSGVEFNELMNSSIYNPYCSQIINTRFDSNASLKALTIGQVLYVDNASWISSNKYINVDVNGYLTLNIDYGFPNPITITTPSNNQILSYNGTNWENKTINIITDHTQLSNIGTNTHSQIDSFINSKSQKSGLASLDGNGYIDITQIPAISLVSVNVVNTIADRNNLVVQSGDVAVVTSDPTLSNNGSYIYSGVSWIALTTYISPSALSSLSDVNLGTLYDNQILQYNLSSGKWINTNLSVGSTTLSGLTDCSTSGVTNDQLLVYTTNSSLNKWTPYTLSGATFNDTNKTISISSSTALSSLTDCSIDIPNLATKSILCYDTSINKWANTNSIPDNIFFIKDDGDGTN